MPLVHRAGEVQVDFGHALTKVNGQLRKVVFFVRVLPYSDASLVMAFERECTETFWEGHVRGFEFFGGRAAALHLRQHEGGGEPDSGAGAAVDAGVSPTPKPLPL